MNIKLKQDNVLITTSLDSTISHGDRSRKLYIYKQS